MSETAKSIHDRVKLSDGNEIPWLGLGVYQTPVGEATYAAVKAALEAGYRHIDSAAAYGNEADVGRAVRDSGIPRGEIFVTTKLWNSDQGYDSALRAFDRSFKNLGLGSIDLYLLHWPVPKLRLESWRALARLKEEGRVRSIGVSNFTTRHLRELFDRSPVRPAVNQVEMSPFLAQRELRKFCEKEGIRLEAYSPLTQGEKLGDPVVQAIAKRHGKSAAQILLRWALEAGVVVLPKSVHPERMRENSRVFDFKLDEDDQRKLAALDENLHLCWDPTDED